MKTLLIILLLSAPCFAACNQPYTRVEEPIDRIGVIIACPDCYEDTITRYFYNKELVKSECNNCLFEQTYEVEK